MLQAIRNECTYSVNLQAGEMERAKKLARKKESKKWVSCIEQQCFPGGTLYSTWCS